MESPQRLSPRLRFASFELDVAAGKLFKSGIPIKLQPQPLRVLLLLTKNRDKLSHGKKFSDVSGATPHSSISNAGLTFRLTRFAPL
jgi:DNA-binding response OmpR family regulator